MNSSPRFPLAGVWLFMLAVLAAAGTARAQERYLAQIPNAVGGIRPIPATDALPPQILSMPEVTAEMKVIQRRSQVLVTRSRIVRTHVADPSVVDIVQYSPTEMALLGMELGTTNVAIWFEESAEPLIYLVETIRDPSLDERRRLDYGRLEQKLAVLFPNSKVYLIPLSGKIIVKGWARDGEEAARILSIVRGEVLNQSGALYGPGAGPGGTGAGLGAGLGAGFGGFDPTTSFTANDQFSSLIVNMLDVPGEYQVALRVRVAELKRSMLRRMGVDFSALINGDHVIELALGGAGSTLTGIFNSGDITVLVNALESNGTAKILAEPTVTVLSGHPASFLSGGEFAVPTIVGINGVGGQQTTFRGFGVSLVVVPTVMDRDLIRMQVLPEFSAIDPSNSVQGIPGTNTRRVSTTVELREGQTIALAGLLSHQSSTEVSGLPVLGQLPVIGPLVFKSKRSTQDETELLILVTPEIVRPMDADEVPPVPGHEVTVPSDLELYLHGLTEGAPDQGVYQLAPYGHGAGHGIPVGYSNYNPAPASAGYGPAATYPFGGSQAPTTHGAPGVNPFGNGSRYQVNPQRGPTSPYQSPNQFPTPAGPGSMSPTPINPAPPAAPPGAAGPGPAPMGPTARRSAGEAMTGRRPARGYTIPTGYQTPPYQRPK